MFMKNLKRKQARREKKIALSKFALGTAVGAAAGVMLAPKSGKQIRKDVSNDVENKKEKAKKVKDAAGEDIEKITKDVKNSKAVKELKK